MDPWVADSVWIADFYLAGAPDEYRKQCAKEILKAIMVHAETIALDIVGEVLDNLQEQVRK